MIRTLNPRAAHQAPGLPVWTLDRARFGVLLCDRLARDELADPYEAVVSVLVELECDGVEFA